MPSRTRIPLASLLVLIAAAKAAWSAEAPPVPGWVEVHAGARARTNCLASFPWPFAEPAPELVSSAGHGLGVQLSEGRAWFVEPGLGQGESRRYQVRVAAPEFASRPAVARRDRESLELLLRGRPAARYLAGPGTLPRADIGPEFRRGGYLHPVLTPAGHAVTDDYPPNHIHQHALWFSWSRTGFEDRAPDFWNMGQKSGRTDFEGLDETESGPVFAGFRSRQIYTDLLAGPPRQVLRETWQVRLLALGSRDRFHAFDLESHQRCVGDSPLRLPKYHYGGFAFRGRWDWNGPTNVLYLDSNGETDRVKANATRPNWFWLGGPMAGPGTPVVGLVQFGHPGNFRAPQPLRVHPTEPYTCWSPSQLGDWAIRPGETYVSRYRVLAMDGPPEATELNRLWQDYVEPPEVRSIAR